MSHKELLAMIYNRKKMQGSKRSSKLPPVGGSKRTGSKQREISAGSKKSANYDRLITFSNSKTEPRIPYKSQVLKQIADGKYGSKIYQDITKKKNIMANRLLVKTPSELGKSKPVEFTIKIGPENQINLIESSNPVSTSESSGNNTPSNIVEVEEPDQLKLPAVIDVQSDQPLPESIAHAQPINKEKIVTTDQEKDLIAKFLSSGSGSSKSNKPSQTDPILVQTKVIKTIADITKTGNKTIETSTLEKKISELEDYIAVLTIEIEKLKNNQKNIARAVNRLSKNGSKTR